MPNYEYRCEKCKNVILVTHSISECDNIRKCEKCGDFLKRIMSSNPAIYNCKGFYNTDYKGFDDENNKN